MFELQVADNDVTGGSIAVSWCTDPEFLKQLAERDIRDPQLVICVAPSGGNYSIRKEVRKVVPLSDLMTYVEFRVPGKNKIWAFVTTRDKKEARNKYLARSSGQFDTDILDMDGGEFAYNSSYLDNQVLRATPVEVYVPEDCFAPEPADWEKAWVNHLFTSKVPDQCAFRKRRLFAYTVQVVIMLLNMMLRVILYVPALLIGAKKTTTDVLFHPLQTSLGDGLNMWGGGTIFVRTWKGDPGFETTVESDITRWEFTKYMVRKFWSLPFMPIIFIPLLLLILAHNWFALGITAGAIVGVVLVFAIIWFFAEGIARKTFDSLQDWVDGLFQKKEMWYLDQDEMELLMCGKGNAKTFSQLPAKKKTLSLRFSNLKAKVCRPFSA